MKLRIKTDVYAIIREMNEKELRQLAFNLIDAWGHPQTCACFKWSEPFEDENGEMVRIKGPSDKDCDCGADERLAEQIEKVLDPAWDFLRK